MKAQKAIKEIAPGQLALAGAIGKGTSGIQGPLTSRFSQKPRSNARPELSPAEQGSNGALGGHRKSPVGAEAPEKFVTKMATVGSSWFAMLVALIYASGFLCIYTHLDRFGIRGTGGDFFRARFVYVGILFLLFPVSVVAPLVVALSLSRIYKKLRTERMGNDPHARFGSNAAAAKSGETIKKPPSIHITSYLLFLNMGWVFYVCLLFTPREFLFSNGKELVVPLIFLTSVLGPGLIQWFVDRFIVHHKSETFSHFLRWTTFILIVAPLDYWTFRGFFAELWAILWGKGGFIPAGAIYYFAFTAIVPYIFWKANSRCKEITNRRGRIETRIGAACVSLMFYFLSINAFAVRVFPYITVAKGGGDYSEGPFVHVTLRTSGPAPVVALQTNTFPTGMQPGAFVIIDQTPLSFFLADAGEAGGPKAWRQMSHLPRVIEIPRERVEQIIYSAF